jgi:hypothetical protein
VTVNETNWESFLFVAERALYPTSSRVNVEYKPPPVLGACREESASSAAVNAEYVLLAPVLKDATVEYSVLAAIEGAAP